MRRLAGVRYGCSGKLSWVITCHKDSMVKAVRSNLSFRAPLHCVLLGLVITSPSEIAVAGPPQNESMSVSATIRASVRPRFKLVETANRRLCYSGNLSGPAKVMMIHSDPGHDWIVPACSDHPSNEFSIAPSRAGSARLITVRAE